MSRTVAGRVMLGVGSVGAAVSIVGSVVGLALLTELDGAFKGSLGLTAEAVEAISSSVELAEDTTVVLEDALQQTESTIRDLARAFADAQALLGATADISENQVAGSVEALERALPALVDVGAVVDRTLTALSAVPFAPEYTPQEPFDESLRSLQEEMAGLSDELRQQAALMHEGQTSLGAVRSGTEAVADDLVTLHEALGSALTLLRDYSATAVEAGDLVGGSDDRIGRQLDLSRVLILVLGATVLAGQVVPLAVGWFLLHPEAAAAWLSTR
ncbi:MAG: hypothetical protein ACR2KP_01415 [Egibacteraceae bacterium]